ncbi:hypothetical protein FB451DRAFT_1413376 [Mycena latifolia]|nr:hypothetical protein FB451DRAFT_1413376 [Mycena latifolia]
MSSAARCPTDEHVTAHFPPTKELRHGAGGGGGVVAGATRVEVVPYAHMQLAEVAPPQQVARVRTGRSQSAGNVLRERPTCSGARPSQGARKGGGGGVVRALSAPNMAGGDAAGVRIAVEERGRGCARDEGSIRAGSPRAVCRAVWRQHVSPEPPPLSGDASVAGVLSSRSTNDAASWSPLVHYLARKEHDGFFGTGGHSGGAGRRDAKQR